MSHLPFLSTGGTGPFACEGRQSWEVITCCQEGAKCGMPRSGHSFHLLPPVSSTSATSSKEHPGATLLRRPLSVCFLHLSLTDWPHSILLIGARLGSSPSRFQFPRTDEIHTRPRVCTKRGQTPSPAAGFSCFSKNISFRQRGGLTPFRTDSHSFPRVTEEDHSWTAALLPGYPNLPQPSIL
jgi:hypothetical protein